MCGVERDYIMEAKDALELLMTKGKMKNDNILSTFELLKKIISDRPVDEGDDSDCPCGCN